MKKVISIICATYLLMISGCDVEEFLDQGPLDEYTSSSVFKTEADMIIASNYLYTFLPHLDQRYGEPRLWLWADDGWRRNGGKEGSHLRWLSTDEFLDFYRYEEIKHCNEFISRIPDATFTTEGIDDRLEAEARFIRALLYERMVFVHGDIPLVTEPQDLDFFPSRIGQRPIVFEFVLDELDEIATVLPASYSGAEEGRVTKWAALALKARACLNAVGWYSDKSFLYDEAEAACEAIIGEGGFILDEGIDGFRRLFMPASDVGGSDPSTGIILSRNYIETVLVYDQMSQKCLPRGAYRGTGETMSNNQAQFGATWNLIQAFQTINGLAPVDDPSYDPADPFTNRDPRFRASFILPGDQLLSRDGGGTGLYIFQPHPALGTIEADFANNNTGIDTGYLIRKYTGLSLSDNYTLEYLNTHSAHADNKIIRYAEVLLMLAETLAADNNPEALDYINMVRNRAGMPSYNSIGDVPTSVMNGTTGNALIDAVLLERRYEFSGEAPHRMVDIWRYKLGDQVYGVVEGIPVDENLPGDLIGPRTNFANTTRIWDDKYYLLPIPRDALDINPNILPNNPGW